MARVEQDGGRIVASRFLPGGFTVPLVAFDGSAGGLSEERTLVVIRRVSSSRARGRRSPFSGRAGLGS